MKKAQAILICILFFFSTSIFSQRVSERLNRGLVAVRVNAAQVFLSWRLLGSDPDNVAFNIYKNGSKINASPITTSTNYTDSEITTVNYTLKTVVNGVETGESQTITPWTSNYKDIVLSVPASMTMPDATTCTYSPGDCSTGDVDGDGEFEIVLKWDPSNAKDNSQSGYTGNVFIDVYKIDGTHLCRIDLGKNIRAGAHYTQFQVADYDGDGKAEIACKTAPGTKDGKGNYISKGPAALASHTTDYRNTSGYILSGPEYLTVFSGLTGEELATAAYNPARGTVSSWGDSYGNRVDRFLAGSAYLDGKLPSIIMCRGYYTRATIAAWDYRNGTLTNRWLYDSGTTSGVGLYGQGNHNLSIGDVDNDGKDEIIWGAGAVNDDGKFMYRTGLGHGDAMHLSDLNPDRKGLEVWDVHEETGAAYGEEMHDAKTGVIIWGTYTGTDNGRGLAANVIGGNRGFEMWSAHGPGAMSKTGSVLSSTKGSMNFRIYWDGDLQDEMLDGNTITKYGVGALLSATGCSSVNGTKSNPCLSADILGDWREELILRTDDNTRLRIFTTAIPTNYRMYTLMQDAVYRAGITWQNTAYNQPPHVGFYVGDDMDVAPVSDTYFNEKRWKNAGVWDNNTTVGWADSVNNQTNFKNGEAVLFDITSGADATLNVVENLSPQSVKVNSPYNVLLNGVGELTGTMQLIKKGVGKLTLNNNNSYSGSTTVWESELYNNGNLSESNVSVYGFSKLGGSGVFGKNVMLNTNTILAPGSQAGTVGTLRISGNLIESGSRTYELDFMVNTAVVSAHDSVIIQGNWTISSTSIIAISTSGGSLPKGKYTLFECTGTITGDITKTKVTGIPAYLSYNIQNQSGKVVLTVTEPSFLEWTGAVDTKWDNNSTLNWKLDDVAKVFIANDSVLFNDNAAVKTVILSETVKPASILFDNTDNYSISGIGAIDGTAKLTKNGSGKLTLYNSNKYTGKTIVNNGTIEFATITNGGIASPIGAATSSSTNIELNGGKLSYIGVSASTDRSITLSANGGTLSVTNASSVLTMSGKLTGTGNFVKEGNGRISFSSNNTYTGSTTIKAGSVVFTSDVANTSALSTDSIILQYGAISMFDSRTTSNTSNWKLFVAAGANASIITDGNSLINGTLSGSGTLNYYTAYTSQILASDASQFEGTLNITTDADGGFFKVYSTKGFPKAKINLSSLVTMMYPVTSNVIVPIGDLTGSANAVLGAGGTGACTVIWEVGARDANSTFNGKITDTQVSGTGAKAGILKTGLGTWTLTNANTFSGGTSIVSGTLMVNNSTGSGLGTGDVEIQTDGTISGSGSISGVLNAYDGAIIQPGNGVGTFTVANQINLYSGSVLVIDIDKMNAKTDVLSSSSGISFNGNLEMNPVNSTLFAAGDTFKILNGNIVGLPAQIIPATPADGLEWDLSKFNSDGVIAVKTLTGVKNVEVNAKIFPVPCKGVLNIHLENNAPDVAVTVSDLVGKTVHSEAFSNQQYLELNLSDLPKGVYMMQMRIDDKVTSKKIIKE